MRAQGDITRSMELGLVRDSKLIELNERKLEMLRAGQEILDLSMINPDLPPPRLLVDKLLELTVRSSNHRYAVARGVRRLREAFAQKYADRFSVKIDPETEVCVTLGSKDGLEQVLRILGASAPASSRVVAFVSPAYPHYASAATLNGFETRVLPLSPSMDEFLTGCAALPRGAVVLLNFPHNPTGALAPEGFYERLVPILLERELFLVNDFVYGELTYSGVPARSVLSLPSIRERVVELYSLSKCYSVPGWRVGAVLGGSRLVSAVSTLKSHIDYGIFLPIQGAAAVALQAPSTIFSSVVAEYARRADLLCGALERIGWEIVRPQAGAAVWARCPSWSSGSYELASFLLERAQVSCSPGECFEGYVKPGEGAATREAAQSAGAWVRFALVAPEGSLRLVVDRIEAALRLKDSVGAISNDSVER